MTSAAVAVAALFWLGGLSRLPSAYRNPLRRPVCIALFCFAVALTLDISAVYSRFDTALGIPNIADLVEHCAGIVGVFALLRTLENLTDGVVPPRSRVALPMVAIAASTACFFAAGTSQEATDFTHRYGHNPFVIAYWGITLGYFAIVLLALARLIRRHSSGCARRSLRIGLRIVGVGVALGVLYSVLKVTQLILRASEQHSARYVDQADSIVLVIGAALIGIGLLLPVLQTTWTATATHLSDRMALLRLRRLWLDVTVHAPDVVLDSRKSLLADLLAPRASYRLYRRVIEIRDVQLTAETAPDTLDLPPASLALLERHDALTDASVHDELASLLELARVWSAHAGSTRDSRD